MTEIPEHLRKRAEEAKAKAAAKAAEARPTPPRLQPPRLLPTPTARSPRTCSSEPRRRGPRPPVAAKTAGAGGGAAVATAAAAPSGPAGPAGRRRSRWSHPAPPDRRQVRLHPGREGQPAGQGPRVAPPVVHRVRGRPGLHWRFLLIFSIFVNAPLLELADFNKTPNPSKAPWYFLGLQELLTMFHPMVAGVLLPGIGMGGLMFAPYIDRNPSQKPEDRKFAISLFTVFMMACATLTIIGSFFRGPGPVVHLPVGRRPLLRAVRRKTDMNVLVIVIPVLLPGRRLRDLHVAAPPGGWFGRRVGSSLPGDPPARPQEPQAQRPPRGNHRT
jgi:menaquinol-cytochrome c reductase cytochrome b/c subunit